MNVSEAIEKRRAYRALEPFPVSDELIFDLAHSASLAPSCFNKQPWHYVFVRDEAVLFKMRDAMSRGNAWTNFAAMIIAVISNVDLDCRIKDRDYYLFDTGMATALLILRATELGYIAHPIAGFDEAIVKEILAVPDDMHVITLVNVGLHTDLPRELSEKQQHDELERPPRKTFEQFASIDKYTE